MLRHLLQAGCEMRFAFNRPREICGASFLGFSALGFVLVGFGLAWSGLIWFSFVWFVLCRLPGEARCCEEAQNAPFEGSQKEVVQRIVG